MNVYKGVSLIVFLKFFSIFVMFWLKWHFLMHRITNKIEKVGEIIN